MQECYNLTVSVSIADVAALWAAAAEMVLAAPGTMLPDIIETIGPSADPDIADCVAMLIAARAFPGCVIDDISCLRATSPDRGYGSMRDAGSPAPVPIARVARA